MLLSFAVLLIPICWAAPSGYFRSQGRSEDITRHVKHGQRIREYCESGYFNQYGDCSSNVRVNWIVLDRPGDRRCHYIVRIHSREGRVYDATCDPGQAFGAHAFERAPLSRRTYGEVVGPSEYTTKLDDYSYRSTGSLSLFSSIFIILSINFI